MAREMLRYAGGQPLVNIPGEQKRLDYVPLGVGAVIPPWNFPLAIMAGMTVASVVTGNTVVLKPSSDAPTIAFKFFEILEEAGLPPGVVNFMTGSGAEVGDVVVDHPKTRYVAFTGSKEIGLRINERAAKVNEGPDLDQASGRRDGWQGRDHRCRRRGSRRSGNGRGPVGVWISGAEVFGVFARDHRRESLRHDARQDRRTHSKAKTRRSD